MNRNYSRMDDGFRRDYRMPNYQNEKCYRNNFITYPESNRYNNAFGNYRGGYDRSNEGPPLGFGPPGPMGPPRHLFPMEEDMRWRRGTSGPPNSNNSYRTSKKDKIIKFLLRCGLPREHVINLPGDILSMMQPLNCGLCAQNFETSDLSQIHYASKNHLKNQKKWLNHRSNPGTHVKEPLKARELYCELCDVHITSIGHAESHYAGKPHRAIVEGRKNPRNPFLLQPNRQGRLKALIRREVKSLKKQVSATADMKTKSDAKPGELYCDICKTSMMCSEQLTTHLNGKRHLNKEKQHILRLMKGEETDDVKKNSSKESAVGDADDTEDMEGDEDEDEDREDAEEDERVNEKDDDESRKSVGATAADDDWGEGGEDWKPSPEDY